MTAEHESSPSPEQLAEAERLSDLGVGNLYMGLTAMRGFHEDSDLTPTVSMSKDKPRYSRRGGRSLPETTGRDVSREIANQEAAVHAVSPEEQAAINKRGIELLRQDRKKLSLNNVISRVEQRTEAYLDPDRPEVVEHAALLEMNAVMTRLKDERESSPDVK